MEFEIQVGTTSKRLPVFIPDAVATDGSGKTGLTSATSGLIAYYWREDAGNAGGTSVTLASATLGTFTSGGFIEKDATHLPGWYEFGIPDAALASGAGWVILEFSGAPGMVPRQYQIQLVGYNPNASVSWTKNVGVSNFPFFMKNSSGAGVTGLTVTATRRIDSGSFASCANSVTEIANGWYTINLAGSDLNGTTIGFRFTGSGAIDTEFTVLTQA